MMPRRFDVLVLGGGGPIGRAIGRRATKAGLRVGLSSRSSAPLVLDAADRTAVASALGASAPVAIVDLIRPRSVPADDREIERLAAEAGALVGIAAEAGVGRVIHASSGAVYGDRGSRPYREDDELGGDSPYARLKSLSEAAVARQGLESGISALSLRIFNVYGPGCAASLINKLVEGPPPDMAISNEFVRDYVHVDDVADAILAACIRPDVMGVLNVATGAAVDNIVLAGVARQGSYRPGAPTSSFNVGAPEAIRARLGWRSTRSALEAVASGSLVIT